jgi:hypothetical protein
MLPTLAALVSLATCAALYVAIYRDAATCVASPLNSRR